MGTSKKTTLQDIAEIAGVTKMTVSKALRNQGGVSESVKAKIVKIAKDLNYDFTSTKYLRNSRTNNIAVLVPEVFMETKEIFYTSIFKYLCSEAIKKKYYLILYVVTKKEEEHLICPHLCRQDKVDGIIILGQLMRKFVMRIKETLLPIVLLDFNYTNAGLDCICTDNIEGMYNATKFLIERQHREIGFVGNINLTNSIRDRYLGYYRALIENGIKINTDYIIKERNDDNNDIDIVLPSTMPTSFVCNSDQAAFRLMEALEKANLRVPEDVSVIGFDDTLYSITSRPKLTTVSVNRKSMAENAITMIMDLLENSNLIPRKIVVSTSIIDRNSVATPRKK